ncbi:hypothetical protein [uncultured Deinococcus sp.]|uniref:hypothetical protein n=1 Tax=uncultured Deinococcus sp. TaxID=158789 RepID=UPI0025E1D75A|nr:hypothetical protein [uncultured Deinococcus sp.]
MLLIAALIVLLLLACVLYATPTRWDAPVYVGNQRQYKIGCRVRAGHLVRVIDARKAVRGDDGYVKAVRS